jgi:hypothetical protein
MHELGLLVYDYIIKSRGFKVIFLGQNVPEDDVYAVSDFIHPDYFFTGFSNGVEKEKLEGYINRLAARYPEKSIFITGHQTSGITCKLPGNVQIVNSALQFSNDILKNLN